MALVPTCTPGNAGQAEPANTVVLGGVGSRTDPVPTCDGGWQWIESIDLVETAQDFQISNLDPAILAQAFGAGFIVMGTAFVIGVSVREVLRMISGR